MRSGGKAAASWRILLLSLLWAVALAKDEVKIKSTQFDHPPLNLNYFEDSNVIVFHDIFELSIYRSDDAGFSWNQVDAIPEGSAGRLVMHPFETKTAFVLTESTTHYKTEDMGKTWKEFDSGTYANFERFDVLSFHADDPKRIILNGVQCDTIFCDEEAVYTTSGFESTKEDEGVKFLRAFTAGCWWARASSDFTTGDKEKDRTRTMCIIRDPFSLFKEDQTLHISDSFFEIVNDEVDEFEPNMDTNHGVTGVVNLAVVKSFLLVATSSLFSDEMALYVTDDTLKWHRAMFPADDDHDHSHQINQEAYTVLESTNYSIQIDVMTSHPSTPMGVMFTSNSNGTYFTENKPYTNRNANGHVDFEKISGIQGVFLVNSVENGAEVDKKADKDKVVVTEITFDDGRTFEPVYAGEDRLHLHSVTEIDNLGRVFSSPAPGLVMGNGNTGKSLGSFADSNLYVSDDAGLTWKMALEGPHKYEFGDSGSILIAVKDSGDEDIDQFRYSLDHGENWQSQNLPKDLKILPDLLTTTQDATSLKFLLLGEENGRYHIVAIDFDGLNMRTCGKDDMEDWHARADEDGKSTCIMGHKQTYRRRKKTADCFVKSDFDEPTSQPDNCDCTDADFECDYNFERDPEDHSKCVNIGPIGAPDGACKDDSEVFMGSSGWRRIPGNTCNRKDGKQKDDEIERKCSEIITAPSPPASGDISHENHAFNSDLSNFQKYYLERGEKNSGDDETVIMRPAESSAGGLRVGKQMYLSRNHGKDWKEILEGEDILGIYPHKYLNDIVFFTTAGKKVIYTIDRGQSFHSFETPTKVKDGFPLSFHPNRKDWLIWVGENCDKVGGSETCFLEASVSTDRGDNWKTLQRYVQRCEFTGHSAYGFRSLEQIVCVAKKEERDDAPWTMVSFNNFLKEDKEFFDGEVTGFATMSEFILVRGEDKETEGMHALASLDGEHYEQVHFPYNFHETHESEYTVLDSSTHSVNLFVRTENPNDRPFGSVIKSNSEGTAYVLSASNVNCNELGYVDFERVAGLEGVTLINVVANADKKDKPKELQTKISHNDGSQWAYLAPPQKDVDGKPYKCSSSDGDESCALHLHHYTERDDRSKTFASAAAVGLLIGTGNVGSTLGDAKDADTFMSTDGGITWANVKKGQWTWQYGDRGAVIVLVQVTTRHSDAKTNTVSYTIDEGKTWKDFKFADEKITVMDITTFKSGASRNFLLWCQNNSGKIFTVNLDFSGLTDKACKRTDGDDSDYYLWAPKHPLQDDDCLFGHVARYLRKKTDRVCHEQSGLQRLWDTKDCECSRRDYECAYNYELDNHQQCSLVNGLEPLTGQQWCADHPNETSWFEPTGYRKVPISTCKGGNELDKTTPEHPCDGYEDEFERKHRTSGVAIFFAVVIPICLAGAIGWWVFQNWSGKFGQIRLGESSAATFDSDQPWVKYPVIAVSAVVAVAAALPMMATSLWRTATGAYERVGGGGGGRNWFSSGPRRFTTRDSFARGRGDYSAVDDDEGELLGEDSDEDV